MSQSSQDFDLNFSSANTPRSRSLRPLLISLGRRATRDRATRGRNSLCELLDNRCSSGTEYCYYDYNDYYDYYYGTPYSSSPGLGHGRFCRAPCGSADTPPANGLCLVGGGAL